MKETEKKIKPTKVLFCWKVDARSATYRQVLLEQGNQFIRAALDGRVAKRDRSRALNAGAAECVCATDLQTGTGGAYKTALNIDKSQMRHQHSKCLNAQRAVQCMFT